MHKNIILSLLILPFIGCTTPNMIMKSWVGHTETELYHMWGPPSKVIDNSHNGKIVIYLPDNNKGATRKKYINASHPVEYIGPGNNAYKKTKLFYITPLGNIYAWKFE